MSQQALGKLKVIDAGHYITGPFCAKLMAQMGAEVIKVERPGSGDPARSIGPLLKQGDWADRSALFFYLNQGKKSITLDLKHKAGKKLFRELVKQAGMIIENFRPGVMDELGLGYESLKQINSKLVMTSVSNFGATGPYRDWKSSELVAWALGGVSYSAYGAPGKQLIRPYGSIAQHMAGLLAAQGSLVAYYHQLQSGQGQHVDVSIMECIASLEEHSVLMASYRGELRKRADRHPTNHPNVTLPCKDGYVHVTTSGAAQWQRLCMIAGFPEEWAREDSPFNDGVYRRQHSEEIDVYLKPWLMSHTKQELRDLGWELLLPFAPIVTVPEMVDDPQYKERNFIRQVPTAAGGKVIVPGIPFIMSRTPGEVAWAPRLGEHNEEVFCGQLGLSREDLARLRGLGTV